MRNTTFKREIFFIYNIICLIIMRIICAFFVLTFYVCIHAKLSELTVYKSLLKHEKSPQNQKSKKFTSQYKRKEKKSRGEEERVKGGRKVNERRENRKKQMKIKNKKEKEGKNEERRE